MSESGKDAVESYLSSLLGDPEGSTDCDTAKFESLKPVTPAASVTRTVAVAVRQEPIQLGSKRQQATALKEVTELEEGRRKELQLLLTRQAFSHAQVKPKLKVDTPIKLKPALLESKLDLSPLRDANTKASHSPSPAPEVAPVNPKLDAGASLVAPPEQWYGNGRPAWGQSSFSVLLFKVSGLTLAVPLASLGHIHKITGRLTPIFGQAEWLMGIQPTADGQIRTINTALYIMPERYSVDFLDTARYVVSIAGLNWGLAVDEVQQPTLLDPGDVTWRSKRGKRPWLAGTVKSAMCALLDVPQLGYELERSR